MNKLIQAISSFLQHCQFEKNLSEKTLKAYRTDLLQLNSFLHKTGHLCNINEITKLELREYVTSICTLKPKSIKRKIASTKALFNYLEYEDILLINPFRKMRIKIKEPKTLPVVMNMTEITKFYKVAYNHKNKIIKNGKYSSLEALRNLVVIELLFTTGARVSEIANLKSEQINLETGNIRLQGKGQKERIIQICDNETISILKSYSTCFKAQIQAEGYFLINRFGNRLSDQSIRNVVKKYAGEAKINKKVTPHTFRHSFATLLLENDVDIKYIQSMLGHSSIMTTQIYTHVNSEKQRQILQSKHPRKDLSMFSLSNAG